MKTDEAIYGYPAVKLTEKEIKKEDDLDAAYTSIYAQINKWLHEKGMLIPKVNSILMNKLVYYISKEVKKTNKHFIIDSGWYIYGPCYEQGRIFEMRRTPITFQPISDYIDPEVEIVCDELIPLFQEFNPKGALMTDFLRHIYTKKCDQPDFRDFYITKHEMMCILHRFNELNHDFSKENVTQIQDHQIAFQEMLFKGDYKDLVNLDAEEYEELIEYAGLMCDYINQEIEEQSRQNLIEEIFKLNNNVVLPALSHLNYSKTFESFNPKFQETVQRTHSKRGHEILKSLKQENKRISRGMFDFFYRGD